MKLIKTSEEKRAKKAAERADWQTTRKERVSYYIGDNAKSMEGYIVQTFMNTFLIFSGVNLVLVATITLIVKIIDAVDDVIFGYIVDRLKLPKSGLLGKIAGKGKYLPWYRLTFWMFPLATVMLFQMPQRISDGAKLVYFTIFYLLYDLTFTIIDIPMNSAIMTVTGVPAERNMILTNKTIITVLVGIISIPLMNFLISEHVGMSISMVSILMSIIFTLMMLPLCFFTKEHNVNEEQVEKAEERYTIKEMLSALKGNKYLIFLFLSNIFYACIRSDNSISLFASYYLYGDSQLLTIPTLIVLIPTFFFQAYAQTLCKKYETYKVAFVSQIIQFVLRLAVFVAGYRNLPVHVLLVTLTSLPSIVHAMASRYMMLDCIEYGKYKTGQESAGIVFALNSFVDKVSASVSSSIGLLILGMSGWQNIQAESFEEIAQMGITQPASALKGLWTVYSGTWVVGIGLCVLFLAFYKLRDKDVALMSKANSGEMTRPEAEEQMTKVY